MQLPGMARTITLRYAADATLRYASPRQRCDASFSIRQTTPQYAGRTVRHHYYSVGIALLFSCNFLQAWPGRLRYATLRTPRYATLRHGSHAKLVFPFATLRHTHYAGRTVRPPRYFSHATFRHGPDDYATLRCVHHATLRFATAATLR